MSDWQSYLTPEERQVLADAEDWCNQPQGPLSRAVRLAGRPFELAFGAVPEALKEALGRAIHGALSSARQLAGATLSRQGVLDRLSLRLGFDVGAQPNRLLRVPLGVLDELALEILAFHRRAAAVGGGAAGATGLVGFLGDVPVLYTLLYRSIQEVATCYGFPVEGEAEEAHMLKVLDVGHFLEDGRRRAGLQELGDLQDLLRAGVPIQDMERFAVAKGLEVLARRLAAGLARRKTTQVVAVVGSLVGAGVNYQLACDVGTVAFHAYRRRFILEVAHQRRRRDLEGPPPSPPRNEPGAPEPPAPE